MLTGIDIACNIPDRGGGLLVCPHHALDLLGGGQDGGVVAVAVVSADVRQGEVGQRPAQVHGDVPGHGDILAAALALDILRV